MHVIRENRVEPMPWAWGNCRHCIRAGVLPMRCSHLGVSYGVRVHGDGSESPVRLVLVHACEWHAWQWARGKLAAL